jgi:hypothetical protein
MQKVFTTPRLEVTPDTSLIERGQPHQSL